MGTTTKQQTFNTLPRPNAQLPNMSFQIFWEKLDSEVATKVQELLSSHFASVDRPSFLGPIQVDEFDFGSVSPSIEILDVTDPFPEFYLPDGEEDEDDHNLQHSTTGQRDFENEADGGDGRKEEKPGMTGSASHSFCIPKDEEAQDTMSRPEIPRRHTQTSSKTSGVAGNVPTTSPFNVKSSMSSSYFAPFHSSASRSVGPENHIVETQPLRLRTSVSTQPASTNNNPSAHSTTTSFLVTDILAATNPGPFYSQQTNPSLSHDGSITPHHLFIPSPLGSPVHTPNSIPSISRTRPLPNSTLSPICNCGGPSTPQPRPNFSPLTSTYNPSPSSSSSSDVARHHDQLCSQCHSAYPPSVSENLYSTDPQNPKLSITIPSSHRSSVPLGPQLQGHGGYPSKHDGFRKSPSSLGAAPSEDDAQVEVGFCYEGDLSLSLTTELKVDFAGSTFMSLPIRLKITGASFAATAIFAYAQQRINFCFLRPEKGSENILGDVHIESEVGDTSKHVLKNVGKIERFIVEQLRKFIYDHLVFPAYHSVEIQDC